MSTIFLPLITGAPPPAPPIRLGVGIAHQRGAEWQARSLALLQPPVWCNWLWDNIGVLAYTPMVFTMTTASASNLKAMAAPAVPLWLLGNEPELPGSAVPPAVAAKFAKEWLAKVGRHCALPGIIVGPGGFDWLEEYLRAGGPVADYWNIHIYWRNNAADWLEWWNLWKGWTGVLNITRPTVVS